MPEDAAARVDGAMAEAIKTDDEANGGETERCGDGVGSEDVVISLSWKRGRVV